jgi:hypothetical protein
VPTAKQLTSMAVMGVTVLWLVGDGLWFATALRGFRRG